MQNTQTFQKSKQTKNPITLICDPKYQILFYDFSETWAVNLLSLPRDLRSCLEGAGSLATRLYII